MRITQHSTPIKNLEIGSIIEVDGMQIIAELDPKISELTRIYNGVIYPIGQFGSIIKIHYGTKLIFGYVGRLRMKSEYEREKGLLPSSSNSARIIEAHLFGEGEWVSEGAEWKLQFERGVATFPLPKQGVYLTPQAELARIHGEGSGPTIEIGEHVGSGKTPCYADMNELLGKHTAVLGSTGSGKSGTVAAILHSILDRKEDAGYESWHPQVIILDPHNEYGAAFPKHTRLCTDENSLSLPYWLLSLQETISLLVGKTDHAATSQSNIVKAALLHARKEATKKLNLNPDEVTVDSPVPYKIEDLIRHIEENKLTKSPSKQESYNSILEKIKVLRGDARLNFIMQDWESEDDSLPKVIEQFLGHGNSIRIVDLSGVPNEVAGITSSAIARMLFSIKLWQSRKEREASPVLLICEEAHRYVPERGEAQYEAAQEAIRRLAKEGRKYGLGLMLVSQRPNEVDATVLSQCNSWIVLRITNDSDKSYVRGILPDSLSGLTKALSGLRRREAIFVGEAAALPSRILIRDLVEANKQLPRSHDIDFDKGWQNTPVTEEDLKSIARRWRLQNRDV